MSPAVNLPAVMMEQGDGSVAEPVQASLAVEGPGGGGAEGEAEEQRRRVVRWLELTRVRLPAVAAEHGWPIRLDHCFMRVLLDNTVGGVWHHTVARPAIRHIGAARLERAIALGEQVLRDPSSLPALNRLSLAWRRCIPV